MGVTDGDTIAVLKADRTQVRIRLHGVDAPEIGQAFGSRAKQAASELAFGKDATIKPRDTDRYGRTVAEVILPDGLSLNLEIVSQNMAGWYRQFAPADREFERLKSGARSARRGLGGNPNPVPPWKCRHPKVANSGQVVGNRRSRVFHAPNCPGAARMKAENKVEFKTRANAEKAGYRKAGDCG